MLYKILNRLLDVNFKYSSVLRNLNAVHVPESTAKGNKLRDSFVLTNLNAV